MPVNLQSDLERQILIDLVRGLAGTSGTSSSRCNATKSMKEAAPSGESLCSYLRTIRRWIVTKEVATLLHCH